MRSIWLGVFSAISLSAVAEEPTYWAPEAIKFVIVQPRETGRPEGSHMGMVTLFPKGFAEIHVMVDGKVVGKFATGYSEDEGEKLAKADKQKKEFERLIRRAKRLDTDIIVVSDAIDSREFLKIDLEGAPQANVKNLENRLVELESRVDELEHKKR